MKTKTLFILILSVVSLCANAQSIYVRADLGAAVCTAPHLAYQYTYTNSGDATTNVEAKRFGMGDGMPFSVAAGYYFGENLGIELGVDYFLAFSHKTVDTRANSSDTYTTKMSGSMLSLVPALVMRFTVDKIKPYARLGIIIGVVNSGKAKTSDIFSSNDYEETDKDYGGVAIGAQAAVGVEYPLSKLLSLFGEVNLNGLSWAPTKGKITKYTENGVDKLGNMTTKEKTWIYVKNLDETQSIANSDPNKYSTVNYSLTNVGIILGVKLNFGK